MKDFFYEPAQGLVRSPEEFGKGLGKGALSLVNNTAIGTFDSLTKITGAIGSGLAFLSFDDNYIAQRRMDLLDEKPKWAGEVRCW